MDRSKEDQRAVQAEVDKLMVDRAARSNVAVKPEVKAGERADHRAWMKGRMNYDLGVMRQPRKIVIKFGRTIKKTAVSQLGTMSVARDLHKACPIVPTRHAAPGTVRPGYTRRSPKQSTSHRVAKFRITPIPTNTEYARREMESLLRRIDGCYRAINRGGSGRAKKTLGRLKAWFKDRFPHERERLAEITQRWVSRAS